MQPPDSASSAASQLQLRLFGRFAAERSGQPLHLPTRKAELLLAYLALYPTEHSREQLATLFWGESADEHARHSLRAALYAIRKQLGADLIAAEKATLQLNPAFPLLVDVREFELCVGRALRSELLPQAALDYYHGDLLTDCDEDWVLAPREHYRALYLDAALLAVRQLRDSGEYAAAIAAAEQVLAADPTNERACQQLILGCVAQGQPGAAVERYRLLQRTLRRKFGIDPAPETAGLYLWLQPGEAAGHPPVPRITNLPIPATSLIGRRAEAAQLKALVRQIRLLTLTGVGGSGKTRLAIRVATDLIDAFPDGVWWVELATISAEALVADSIAKALALYERPGESAAQTLIGHLRERRLLLILDNCEHVIDACAQLVGLIMSSCPQVTLMATSREVLLITGEHVYPVPTLAAPEADRGNAWERWLEYPALQLFVERASAAEAALVLDAERAAAVAQICRQLDGIPLAIELAAVRFPALSIAAIAARLGDRLALVGEGGSSAPPRQQTLRATLDWSYELLTEAERILLRRLAVFVGPFSLAAAEQVCAPLPSSVLDLLAHLVHKSLVVVEHNADSAHYRLLETIRQYAREQLLAAGEHERLQDAHLAFFTALVGAAEPEYYGSSQEAWIIQLERAHDNVRAALRWAIEEGDSASALRLSALMGEFWEMRGYWSEGRQWLERALALSQAETTGQSHIPDLAHAFWQVGALAWRQCDFANARELLGRSLALYRELGPSNNLGFVLGHLGAVAFEEGDYSQARAIYEEVLAVRRALGWAQGIGDALFCLGLVSYHLGEHVAAQSFLLESLQLSRTAGNALGITYPINALGNLANLRGDFAAAQTWYDECLAMRRALGYKRGVAATLADLANLRVKQGDYTAARAHCAESLALFHQLGNQRGIACTLSVVACIARAVGEPELALQLFGGTEALLHKLRVRFDEPQYSDMERTVAALQAQVGGNAAARAWEVGSWLSLNDLLALAHTLLDSSP